MFLLRGAFWVAVVAAISPREADAVLPTNASADANVMIDSFRERVRATLSRVKDEFQEEDRQHLGRLPD
jgi:hypothetical protein